MYEKVKKEMISTIQNMSLEDDFCEVQKKLEALFSILISTKAYIPKLFEHEPVTDKYDEQKNHASSPKGYQLERRLRGGILQITDDHSIYVPETIIRNQNFKKGDMINPKKIPNSNNFFYEKVKDGPKLVNDSRGEIDYCIVSEQKVNSLYTASQYLADGVATLIKLDNEVPMAFLISEEDTQKFRLVPGSIVSIAYDKNKPTTNRVIWCYQEEDIPKRPKPSGYYKTSNSATDPEELKNESNKNDLWVRFENSKSLLDDKEVLLIGSDFKKAEYNQLASEVNFNLTVMTGHEKETQLQAAIRNSDMVLIASGHLTHHRSELPREICKLYNIPMRFISLSVSGMKRGLLDFIENPEVLVSNSY
ncbi:DUF2325 domain-containing protein [Lysinibacillus sp. UGB7]|uniref:DUF2325 domain-containing protein n=1 Tax=Lysinibacillus sp. UGB7 TaxID=3411039 RepID=UPI003B7B615F